MRHTYYIIGFLIGLVAGCTMLGADEAPPCTRCKIVGSVMGSDDPLEQFNYPFTFPDHEACEHERTGGNFKTTKADMQNKANALELLCADFKGLTTKSECLPI